MELQEQMMLLKVCTAINILTVKAIAHAWTILGDEEKRSNYNRFGIDGGSSRGVGANPFAHNGFGGRHHQFEGEISPEDLLRMFMGGGGGFGGGRDFILLRFNTFYQSSILGQAFEIELNFIKEGSEMQEMQKMTILQLH